MEKVKEILLQCLTLIVFLMKKLNVLTPRFSPWLTALLFVILAICATILEVWFPGTLKIIESIVSGALTTIAVNLTL